MPRPKPRRCPTCGTVFDLVPGPTHTYLGEGNHHSIGRESRMLNALRTARGAFLASEELAEIIWPDHTAPAGWKSYLGGYGQSLIMLSYPVRKLYGQGWRFEGQDEIPRGHDIYDMRMTVGDLIAGRRVPRRQV